MSWILPPVGLEPKKTDQQMDGLTTAMIPTYSLPNFVCGDSQEYTPQPLYNTIVGVHSINRVS